MLPLRNMQHNDQLSNTQQKQSIENLFSFVGPGQTMLRFPGANNIPSFEKMVRAKVPGIVTTLTIGPKAHKILHELLYIRNSPTNEGIDKSNPYDTVPRIMEYEMIPDTLPHPTRSSVTTIRAFLLVAILAVGCALSANSLLFAAELFPYAPPSSQQRSVEQYPAPKPQLSSEDEKRISRIAAQAKQLSPTDRTQWKLPAASCGVSEN